MIQKIIKYILFGFAFLFPLFYTNLTAESYEFNKLLLLIVTACLIFVFSVINTITNGKIRPHKSQFGLPLIFLSLAALISTIFQSPNLTIALTNPLSVTTIIAAVIMYFAYVNYFDKKDFDKLILIFIVDGLIISLYSILLVAGVLPKNGFTPVGSLLFTGLFLLLITFIVGIKITKIILEHGHDKKVWNDKNPILINFIIQSTALIFLLAGLLFVSYKLFTDQKPFILGFTYGWAILLETYKNYRSFFLGVGYSNFITAYTIARPIFINSMDYWNLYFTSSSSYLLNLATEGGVLSLIIFLFMAVKIIRYLVNQKNLINHQVHLPLTSIKNKYNPIYFDYVILAFAVLLMTIFPSGMTLFIMTIILMAATGTKTQSTEIDLTPFKSAKYVFYIVLVFPAAILFFTANYFLADFYYKKSLDAVVANNGKDAYNNLLNAIRTNPNQPNYHIAFSQINFSIADNLAGKKDITEEEKQNIPRLVQQSVDSARNAVILYRTYINSWKNLARVYSSLVNFAQGAEQWSVSSYQQLIGLDPISPVNRLEYGQLLRRLNRSAEAETNFRQSINLKPDFAGARYNLANILKEQKKFPEAYQELTSTQVLLQPESDDAKKVKDEIDELKKLLPEEETTKSGTLRQTENTDTNQTLPEQKVNQEPNALQKLPTPRPTVNIAEPPVSPTP